MLSANNRFHRKSMLFTVGFFFFFSLCSMHFYSHCILKLLVCGLNDFQMVAFGSSYWCLAPHNAVSMLFHFLEPAEFVGCFL